MAKHVYFLHETKGAMKVKQGFSWPAFFFGSLWAAVKGMWLPHFLVLAVIDVILWVATGFAEASGAAGPALLGLAASLIYAIVRGKRGNAWLTASLTSKGYAPVKRGATGA